MHITRKQRSPLRTWVRIDGRRALGPTHFIVRSVDVLLEGISSQALRIVSGPFRYGWKLVRHDIGNDNNTMPKGGSTNVAWLLSGVGLWGINILEHGFYICVLLITQSHIRL